MDCLHMSRTYKVRPSEILNINDDPYTAYCFDEACAYMLGQIDNKKTPRFPSEAKKNPLLRKMEAGQF